MHGLRFSFAQLQRELESARALTRPFIENGDYIFPRLQTELENLQQEPTRNVMRWSIPEADALRTVRSNGEHEVGSGGIPVVGSFSFVWEIKRIATARRKDRAKELELAGLASSKLRILDGANADQQLAMWRVEVGDDNSPGCHFHVQVLGEQPSGPFPTSLAIPRLPSCLPTPMAALEFLLAELFQERWRKHVASETDTVKTWRSIQRRRLQMLLEWQSKIVSSVTDMPPWPALKYAKPPLDLFVQGL